MKLNVIGILDIGISNIGSIERMLIKIGAEPFIVRSPRDLTGLRKLIIPGVGSFDHGMSALKNKGMSEKLKELAQNRDIAILGICLGMHLLCLRSEEGAEEGLGLVRANVKKFVFHPELGLTVPHMGWRHVRPQRNNLLIDSHVDSAPTKFYFVHSYYTEPSDNSMTIATADYGGTFCAAFQAENIFGVQFHPEKSHKFGLTLFRNFAEF